MFVRLFWFVWYRGGMYGGVCIHIVKVCVCLCLIVPVSYVMYCCTTIMCFPIFFSNFVFTVCRCVHPVRVTRGRGMIYICLSVCPILRQMVYGCRGCHGLLGMCVVRT